MKKVVILQSNYIPWKGYFDLINFADIFVFYDDVQFTVRDWRNRNKIKTPNGALWLTIPCGSDRNRLICEVELKDPSWQREHWQKIEFFYKKAPYFKEYKSFFEDIYLGTQWRNLSDFNQYLIKSIAREILGIKTVFEDSRKYNCTKSKMDRILEILDKMGDVSEYITGPAAKDYLVEQEFVKRNIELTYMDYIGYPEYPQLYSPPFISEVSIIDLLFNTGKDAVNYMKSFQVKR